MKKVRKIILAIWMIIFAWFWIFYFEQNILEAFVNSHTDTANLSSIFLILLKVLGTLLVIILAIPCLLYFYLHLPRDLTSIGIISIILLGSYFIILYYENLDASREKEREQKEKKRLEEEEKRIRDEQLRKEKEIERRKNIVLDIVNNLYKETEKEVNKTLIPTLINELYDSYNGLHSDNMDDFIINSSSKDFQNIINSIKSELNRLKNLALEAQSKGFTDDKNYNHSTENDNKMTEERALKILGMKSSATKEEIKKAYRAMVMKYNTDHRAHYEEHIKKMLEDKMKEIINAKDYLSTLGLYE